MESTRRGYLAKNLAGESRFLVFWIFSEEDWFSGFLEDGISKVVAYSLKCYEFCVKYRKWKYNRHWRNQDSGINLIIGH